MAMQAFMQALGLVRDRHRKAPLQDIRMRNSQLPSFTTDVPTDTASLRSTTTASAPSEKSVAGALHRGRHRCTPGAVMAGLIEPPRAAIGQQARLLELDAGFGDPALYGVILNNRPPESGT